MSQELDLTLLILLDDFLTVMVRETFTLGQPVEIEFRLTALFNPSGVFELSIPELDDLINDAFTGDNLLTYLGLVQGLPPGNIFTSAVVIVLSQP